MTRRKPSKIVVCWNADLTLSFYAGKKLIVGRVKMYDRLEASIKPIMTGWFNSENPADWNYRLIIRVKPQQE